MQTVTKLAISVAIVPFAVLLTTLYDGWDNGELLISLMSIFPTSNETSVLPTVHDSSRNITYIGTLHKMVERYQGIFYAEDTSGKNRFAPPKPLFSTSNSIIDARSPGAWCPQGTGGPPLPFTSSIENISENCLSLGITRPRHVNSNASLPVLVWIHGGGHALGSYADQLYNPSVLVEQSAADGWPIIVVGINYRLGLFGFARIDALSKAGHTNVGLRDQRAAFEWIRQNIEPFGGNSENIIAIGQSVGASDTGLHITSYGGRKGVPFQKAIMMSGAPGLTFNMKSDHMINNTAAVAKALDCVVNENSQSEETLRCLKEAPMEDLMNVSVTASRTARPPFGEGFFQPTHDDDYIPDFPSELLRRGEFVPDIPIIASWVTNEGAWYAPPSTATDKEVTSSLGVWLSNVSESTLETLLRLYPIDDFQDMARSRSMGGLSPQYYRAAQINRDIWFTCPVLDFTHHYALHSTHSVASPVYLYEHNATRFTPIFTNIMNVPFWGVSHLSDIPYVLDNDVAAGGDNSPTAKALAKDMGRFMIRFAYTGELGQKWPRAFHTALASKGELPPVVNLMVFRHQTDSMGSGAVTVTRSETGSEDTGSSSDRADSRAVEWEKLFERCDFINSDEVRAEIGV